MPLPAAHPQTVLHLIPINAKAFEVLDLPQNAPFVSPARIRGLDGALIGQLGLEIGCHVREQPTPGIIVEVGREADLILPDPSLSRVQFSFEVHPESMQIMFHDRSQHKCTHIQPYPFRTDGDFRQVVLVPQKCYQIGTGGPNNNLYTFHVWWLGQEDGKDRVAKRAWECLQGHTMGTGTSGVQAWYNSSVYAPLAQKVQRVLPLEILGVGTFGVVRKAVDLDSGNLVAVKIISLQAVGPLRKKLEANLSREIRTLSEVSHPHIVEFLGSKGWRMGIVQIYMGLKSGTVLSLVQKFPSLSAEIPFLSRLLKQMLGALDYLADRRLCHRDVKPDNILYTGSESTTFAFQLADFGYSAKLEEARPHVCHRVFLPPEVYKSCGDRQSAKMDVWALFVTIAYLMRPVEFSEVRLKNYPEVLEAVRDARNTWLIALNPMARENHLHRASAAQMLVQLYGGDGLTTPRVLVKPITYLPQDVPAVAAQVEWGRVDQRIWAGEQQDPPGDQLL